MTDDTVMYTVILFLLRIRLMYIYCIEHCCNIQKCLVPLLVVEIWSAKQNVQTAFLILFSTDSLWVLLLKTFDRSNCICQNFLFICLFCYMKSLLATIWNNHKVIKKAINGCLWFSLTATISWVIFGSRKNKFLRVSCCYEHRKLCLIYIFSPDVSFVSTSVSIFLSFHLYRYPVQCRLCYIEIVVETNP